MHTILIMALSFYASVFYQREMYSHFVYSGLQQQANYPLDRVGSAVFSVISGNGRKTLSMPILLSIMEILLFHNMLAFLVRSQSERCPSTDDMAFPHKHYEEAEGKDTKECHHAVKPSDICLSDPCRSIKVDGQA